MISREEKKQKILAVVLVVCLLIMAIVLVWNFSGTKTSNRLNEIIPEATDSFPYLDKEEVFLPSEELVSTELDLKVLESMQFKELRSHGDLPVKSGETGRLNPFLPY